MALGEALLEYLRRQLDAPGFDDRAWRDAPYPEPLLQHLKQLNPHELETSPLRVNPGRRKARHFAAVCCRRVEHLVRFPRLVELVRMVEEYADRRLGLEEMMVEARQAKLEIGDENVAEPSLLDRLLREAHRLADYELFRPTPADRLAHAACLKAADGNSASAVDCWNPAAEAAANAGADLSAELEFQADLLRDLFGNPFRPAAFDPAWRSAAAVALARSAYESGDFAALPILADALQEAGCEDADVLDHCRGNGPHARGCWVVDAVLGL